MNTLAPSLVCRWPYPGLAADDEDPAAAGADIGQQPVEHRALVGPVQEPARLPHVHHRLSQGVTEYYEFEDRAHALTIDPGWRDVADKALEFVKRYA